MFCGKCGATIADSSKFCPACGTVIANDKKIIKMGDENGEMSTRTEIELPDLMLTEESEQEFEQPDTVITEFPQEEIATPEDIVSEESSENVEVEEDVQKDTKFTRNEKSFGKVLGTIFVTVIIMLSLAGIVILSIGLGRMTNILSEGYADFASERYFKHIQMLYPSGPIYDNLGFVCMISIYAAIALALINIIVIVVCNGKKCKMTLPLISLILSVLCLVAGLSFMSVNYHIASEYKAKLDPYTCFDDKYDYHDKNTVLDDLERLGLYESDVDYSDIYPLSFSNVIRVEDSKGKKIAVFPMVDKYMDPIYIKNRVTADVNKGIWKVEVDDGHVKNVNYVIGEEEFLFVENGKLLENATGNFNFTVAIENYYYLPYQYNLLPSIRVKIAEDNDISPKDINIDWEEDYHADVMAESNTWCMYKVGTFELNGQEKTVIFYLRALDEQELVEDIILYGDDVDTSYSPYRWNYVVE